MDDLIKSARYYLFRPAQRNASWILGLAFSIVSLAFPIVLSIRDPIVLSMAPLRLLLVGLAVLSVTLIISLLQNLKSF